MASTTTTTTVSSARRHKKIVVIMGPTGCGKSKLSVDLASRFFPSSEIINSDKIQVYRGLDITTNKIPFPDRKNVPHHLLGEIESSEFSPSDFRSSASLTISQILSRRKIPFIVGGSNSFIYALLAKKFNPEIDVFSESNSETDSVFCKELRYSCCFIWVDVSPPVLNQYLVKRVDDMLESGMLEELAEYFASPQSESASQCGLKKAIGVPEFQRYLKRYQDWRSEDDVEKMMAYEEAVRAIKDNTCQLAKRQLGKILRLRDGGGWELKRVEATESLRAAMSGGRRVADMWERQVVEPSVKIVKRFLME
ncbi:Adenylate isopentenyltransferase [Sesamum alatum]|uniref:Adenylate isopentenyltransferase n=1 Tax=Sesamum alatum TaxID=300844 RepID=A0AAE2CIM7_9LAMI|nr:Adenylate isopentenyltransferase [Sesamum alatum]